MNGWGFPPADWDRFAEWLVTSTDHAMLESQGIGGVRAGLRRQRGLAPADQDQEWLTAGATAHATQLALLDRIGAVATTDVIVLKGPEVASRYPEPAWRNSSDLDLFSLEAGKLWDELVANGFAPTDAGDRHDRHHHLSPLHLPGFRLGVEVHRSLGWLAGSVEPEPEELARTAVGSQVHPAFGALPPAMAFAHQLQHAWHGVPYGTIRDVVDLAMLWGNDEPSGLSHVLARTRLDRLHASTRRLAGHVLSGNPSRAPRTARLVARPTLHRQPETMRLAVARRIIGLTGAAGFGFAARSISHDAARVAARHQ